MRAALASITMFATLMLAACAGSSANRDSAEYQAGYTDGCATGGARAQRIPQEPQRDAGLYERSSDYRAGWGAGYNVCGTTGNPGRF